MLTYCPTEVFILTEEQWNASPEKRPQAFGGHSCSVDHGLGAEVLVDVEDNEANTVLALFGREVTCTPGVRVTWETLTQAEHTALHLLQHHEGFLCTVRSTLKEALVVLNPCFEVELVKAAMETPAWLSNVCASSAPLPVVRLSEGERMTTTNDEG